MQTAFGLFFFFNIITKPKTSAKRKKGKYDIMTNDKIIKMGMEGLTCAPNEPGIKKINTEIRASLIIIATELGKQFGIDTVMQAIATNPETQTEIDVPSNKDRIIAENRETLKNNLERMYETCDPKEFIESAQSAQYCIYANTQIALKTVNKTAIKKHKTK